MTTNETLLFLAVSLLVMAATPFVVYLSVKLGTYAFFRGRDLYQKDHPTTHQGDRDNG